MEAQVNMWRGAGAIGKSEGVWEGFGVPVLLENWALERPVVHMATCWQSDRAGKRRSGLG